MLETLVLEWSSVIVVALLIIRQVPGNCRCNNPQLAAYLIHVRKLEKDFDALELQHCNTPAQGLIGLIGYSYQQVATSFLEIGLQRTPRFSVLGPEKFGDG